MKNKRLWSLGLTGILVVSSCGCSGNTGTSEQMVQATGEAARTEEEEQAVEIAKKAVVRSENKEAQKEETVYVNADANGTVKNITVSNWLKNGNGAEELTDVTKLTDVVNVKGDETFTQDGDTYVWSAGGNDIYYQGETSESLPVNVKVTYYLNDSEIAPEELAGKSGRIKIRFDYENLTSQTTVIGGEETELCVPFVAASTMILDSDKFVNVEVENGKILSDGKNTIVAGVAMPGLYDSLDLLNLDGFEDIDIPDYVEVTADVTEFELGMTATVLLPDVLSELNTDDMDGFDDLKDDVEELNDATYELIDGCIELDDGVQELKDNMPDLMDGAEELDDGAVKLNDGAWELDNGAQDLMDGADQLNDGAKDIREGAGELDAGTGTLQAGIGQLAGRLPALSGGVNSLAAGLQSLQDPMMLGPDGQSGDAEHPYIKTSVGLLKDGVDTLAAGVGGMETALEQKIAENQKEMQAAAQEVANLKAQITAALGTAQAREQELIQAAAKMNLISSGSSRIMQEENSGGQTSEEIREAVSEDPKTDSSDSAAAPDDSLSAEAASEALKEEPSGSAAVSEKPEMEPSGPAAVPESSATESVSEPEAASAEQKDEKVTQESGSEEALGDTEAMTEDLSDIPEAASEADGEEEPSEFAKAYLRALSRSGGMVPAGMVQTADQGQDPTPAPTDAAAVDVIILQTKLIDDLSKVTDLQTQLQAAVQKYAALAGADTALREVAGQLSAGADAEQLARLTEGMAALETSVGQIYDGVALINSQMGTLTRGTAELGAGVGSLKTGADALKGGTEKLYQGSVDLREGTKELYEGTRDLKDGTEDLKDGTGELKDGTQELKDGVVDLVDGVDELKDGTEELLDGVHEYNDDGIQKLYDAVNVDLQNLLDRVDAIADLSGGYQSFSGKSDAMEGSVKFIIETDGIELDEE